MTTTTQLSKRLEALEQQVKDRARMQSGVPTVNWQPNPGRQTEAYNCEADELFYGGRAGGGKTDLLLGLAGTKHRRSVIFRRVFPLLRAIVERSRELFAKRSTSHLKDSYNESLHLWRLADGRIIEFDACQHEKDKERQRGRPRDFYGFDEIPEFTETMYRFIIAWNRSTYKHPRTKRPQRCRVVVAGNPPSNIAGEWVIRHWGPWLDRNHPLFPVETGKLLWVARVGDEDRWFETSDTVLEEGTEKRVVYLKLEDGTEKRYRVRSRTFIPAGIADNPYLDDTDYEAVLEGLPEPLRSQMLEGRFDIRQSDQPWQVIPTEWIEAAQARWVPMSRDEAPITAAGVDVARGGKAKTAIATRSNNYFHEVQKYPGTDTPDGMAAANYVIEAHGIAEYRGTPINIDIIGVGASVYDILDAAEFNVGAVNFARASRKTDRSGWLKMYNIRAEAYWTFREALDPKSGLNIALPPGDELKNALAAPSWSLTARGVIIEDKEDIIARVGNGRGLDDADAIVMAWLEPQPNKRKLKKKKFHGGSTFGT